jgi:hypothetical protein
MPLVFKKVAALALLITFTSFFTVQTANAAPLKTTSCVEGYKAVETNDGSIYKCVPISDSTESNPLGTVDVTTWNAEQYQLYCTQVPDNCQEVQTLIGCPQDNPDCNYKGWAIIDPSIAYDPYTLSTQTKGGACMGADGATPCFKEIDCKSIIDFATAAEQESHDAYCARLRAVPSQPPVVTQGGGISAADNKAYNDRENNRKLVLLIGSVILYGSILACVVIFVVWYIRRKPKF